MRLPYGTQADEKDAQLALEFIKADKVLTVDVKAASDAALAAVDAGDAVFRDEHHRDFVHGNIKARQRMIAQYAVAGAHGGLVVGTDHAAEAVSGFFTKFGDGAADVVPLTGLTKRRVRAVSEYLGAPAELVWKMPTADLETLNPGKSDEEALGVTYDDIDDFLEGKPVDAAAFEIIARRYKFTEHKRQLPIAP
jgi:NAD+ synthase